MAAFKLRAAAKADLKRIAVFTEQRWDRKQRNEYLKQLDDAFHRLAENKEIGKPCDYLRAGYRKFPVSSHIIYYKIGKYDRVEIVRILHKRMDVFRSIPKA